MVATHQANATVAPSHHRNWFLLIACSIASVLDARSTRFLRWRSARAMPYGKLRAVPSSCAALTWDAVGRDGQTNRAGKAG